MKQCRECGTLSSDDTVFCYICGTRFPDREGQVSAGNTEETDCNDELNSAKMESRDESVLFEGLYQCKYQDYSSYLRFFDSGVVVEVGSTGTPEQVVKWLTQNYESHGTYTISNGQITFDIFSSSGQVSYSGRIINSSLLQLDIRSYINGYTANNLEYHFRKCL